MQAFIMLLKEPQGHYAIQRAEPGDENKYVVDYRELDVDAEFFMLALMGEIPVQQLQAQLKALYEGA